MIEEEQIEKTFYDEFIKNKNQVNIDHELYNNNLKVEKFLEHFIENNEINYESIKMLSNGLKNYISKPQRILINNPNDYVGVDMNTNIHYICFRDVLMFDIDLKDHDHEIGDDVFLKKIKKEFLINKLENSNDVFYLDESSNGFHIFLLNKRVNHKSEEAINYMIDFDCDIKYIICSFLRGFSIRINKKNIYDPMYTHIGIYGNKNLIDESILNDVKKIQFYVDKYDTNIKY